MIVLIILGYLKVILMEISKLSIKTSLNRENHKLLPRNLRALIIGKSSAGKSVLLYNLLLKPWLDYDNLLVFGNSLHQPEYQVIKKGFEKNLSKEQLINLFENQSYLCKAGLTPLEAIEEFNDGKGKIKANFFNDCESIPDPSSLDPQLKNLLVLDDCYLGRQNKAEAYYSRGRHSSCDTIFLSQNYFRLPRQSIRENSNFFMLFPQDAKNLSHIHTDHCSDISFEEFRHFCQEVWAKPHNFITIDLTSGLTNGKYRENLDTFYIPQKFVDSS